MTITNTLIDKPDTDSLPITSQHLTSSIGRGMTEKQELLWGNDDTILPKVPNVPGEGVNRFLICTLVIRTAKQMKARAERTGVSLPMAAIVKSVLRSYQSVANREPGLLAGSALNLERLRSLIESVMKKEVLSYAQEIVGNNHARLAQAGRVGDEGRIKAETEALERAIASRKRLSAEFR